MLCYTVFWWSKLINNTHKDVGPFTITNGITQVKGKSQEYQLNHYGFIFFLNHKEVSSNQYPVVMVQVLLLCSMYAIRRTSMFIFYVL